MAHERPKVSGPSAKTGMFAALSALLAQSGDIAQTTRQFYGARRHGKHHGANPGAFGGVAKHKRPIKT